MNKKNSVKIDIFNILLMLVSLIVSLKIPFDIFLFSYAVLGPLHYITEINWLNDKNFFSKNQNIIFLFSLITVLISLPFLLSQPICSSFNNFLYIKKTISVLIVNQNVFILSSFIFSVFLLKFQEIKILFMGLVLSIILSTIVLKYISFSTVLVGVFLPTLIHVYIFTFLFMIYGTIKNPNKYGIMAIGLLSAIPFIFYNINIDTSKYNLSERTKTNYTDSSFPYLVFQISKFFSTKNEQFYLLSELGIRIQMFIAFAYTYHYLNWFSKINIIGWGKSISKKKRTLIISFWLLSIILYWYNYKIGFTALFFLSFLHVLLEFPLNISSIYGIIRTLKRTSN